MNPEGSKEPCPFQHCCANFSKGNNGNCVVEMDDVLECWVDTTNPEDIKDIEALKSYFRYHGYSYKSLLSDNPTREEILEEIKRQDKFL